MFNILIREMIKYLKLGSLFVFTFEDMSVKVCCGVSLTRCVQVELLGCNHLLSRALRGWHSLLKGKHRWKLPEIDN